MEKELIEKQLGFDHLLETAIKHYINFKENSRTYDETYKWDILGNLNTYFQEKPINEDTIFEIIQTLKKNNPQTGSFTHWSSISDLETYTKERPKEVAQLLHNLYQDKIPLKEKLDAFYEAGKQYNKELKLGAPLFGYLLAAYDYKKYPLYKEDTFKQIKKGFGIDKKLGSVSENYAFYYEFCAIMFNHLINDLADATMLDVQDFLFSIVSYEDLELEIAVDYIHRFSLILKEYKQETDRFLDTISKFERSFLERRREFYRGKEKVNQIRFRILNEFLEGQEFKAQSLHRIGQEVDQQYEKNILHSWSNFNILFQIYYDYYKERIEWELEKIHLYICNIPQFSEVSFVKGKTINAFNWNQNFGTTECWLAAYPEGFQSHKLAAQLFFSIDADSIRYGLLYGSESEKRGVEDLEKLTEVSQFTAFRFRQKLIDVFPSFLKENEVNDEISLAVLASPFSNIFDSLDEAEWAFEFMRNLLGDIGITEPGDERVSVTYRKDSQAIHLNYCSWLLLGFSQNNNQELIVQVPLLEQKIKSTYAMDFSFNQPPSEEKINCYLVPSSDIRNDNGDVKNNLESSLLKIKERFASQFKSQYRKYNIRELENAIWNQKELERILIKGLDISKVPSTDGYTKHSSEILMKPVDFAKEFDLEALYFENKTLILKQVRTALAAGKHIIFTGPPGTGKSKLAKEICRGLEVDYSMTTATSDWSTYETIGGYRPNPDGTLSFQPGHFLRCFKDPNTNAPRNHWLIIDEMNRADIDKAFGSLFSVLTGDEVSLPFSTDSDHQVILKPQVEHSVTINDYEYIVPRDWRLIGTMNTFDKASLYEMSYAFMRRFAFIPIGTPKIVTVELINFHLSQWGLVDYHFQNNLLNTWLLINDFRQIGPAIIEDIAKYTVEEADFTSAISLYVLPQFEGLMESEIRDFINRAGELENVDYERLEAVAIDFFQMGD